MASSWVLLEDAVRHATAVGQPSVEREILILLRCDEIASRAMTVLRYNLVSTQISLDPSIRDKFVYIASDSLLQIEVEQLACLSLGQHYVVTNGRSFTAVRNENDVDIYWEVAGVRKTDREELGAYFWRLATVDAYSSHAVADDLGALTRTVARGVELSRKDLDRFWPGRFVSDERETPAKKRGPKPVYDWPGALAQLAKRENENRLPIGRGAKAKLEKLAADWFAKKGEHPSTSLIREHVSRFMQKFGR